MNERRILTFLQQVFALFYEGLVKTRKYDVLPYLILLSIDKYTYVQNIHHIEINKLILNFYFSDIPYLRELHLNRNPLQKIEANAFVMVPDLVSLDLSHSNIKRVAAKAFSQLDSLEKLYINHNEIRELKRATVETFKGNNMMDIYLDLQRIINTYIYQKNQQND